VRAARIVVSKPDGGYVLTREDQLRGAWERYREKAIELGDLRVYLAILEVIARRCKAGVHALDLDEVGHLTGLRRPGPAVARLRAAGLLGPGDGPVAVAPGRSRHKVPIPRRMLRHLARHGTRALIATALGHLIRCLWHRARKCVNGGRCKASAVAETFGVDLRRVKAARAALVAMGWLRRGGGGDPQWVINRHGEPYTVNMEWGEMPPPSAAAGADSPPPESDGDPSPRRNDQEPGEPGVSIRDVKPEDLRQTGRTLELHRQAVARGWVADSEHGRVRVVAAAEHARAVGTTNPPGLFRTILSRGLWAFLSAGEEERASRRIREHLFPPRPGVAGQGAGRPARPDRPTLSEDARVVREVRGAFARAGRRDLDPFPHLRRQRPEWTRARWDAALAELEGDAAVTHGRPDAIHRVS
jgi:hypothetical protein